MAKKTPQGPSTSPEEQKPEAGGPRYILETTLAVLALLGFFFTAFLFIEYRYAKDVHLTKVELGLQLNGLGDKLSELQTDISKFEYELSTRKNDALFENILKKLRKQEETLSKEMEIIKTEMTGMN